MQGDHSTSHLPLFLGREGHSSPVSCSVFQVLLSGAGLILRDVTLLAGPGTCARPLRTSRRERRALLQEQQGQDAVQFLAFCVLNPCSAQWPVWELAVPQEEITPEEAFPATGSCPKWWRGGYFGVVLVTLFYSSCQQGWWLP